MRFSHIFLSFCLGFVFAVVLMFLTGFFKNAFSSDRKLILKCEGADKQSIALALDDQNRIFSLGGKPIDKAKVSIYDDAQVIAAWSFNDTKTEVFLDRTTGVFTVTDIDKKSDLKLKEEKFNCGRVVQKF